MDGLDTSIPVPDAKCQRALTKFDIALNVVSIILMVALSFLQKRKFLKMDICHGRPGVIYPVNLLDDRTCRFTYAAAFGLASASIFKYLVGEGDPFGVKDVPSYLKALWLIVVVTFTGSAYYPLFVSITLESVVTYIIGTIYSWIFLIRTILDVFLCNKESETSGVMTAAQLPVLTCALYLSIRFPIVLVKYILQYRHTRDMEIDFKEKMASNYQAQHVKRLLYGPQVNKTTTKERDTNDIQLTETFIERGKRVAKRLYIPIPGFKYSTRMISTIVVSIIVIYEFLVLGIWFTILLTDAFFPDGEDLNIKACAISSLVLAFIVSICVMLHMLQKYRDNTLAVCRGDHSLIPSVDGQSMFLFSPAMRVVSGSRYIGFQVAYMAWGFIIQSVLLFVFIWIFVFFLSESQGREYLVQGLGYIGPLVVVGILVTVIQYVMARFVFLQDKGQSFALDNRRLFHNFTYFMFFYNAFLGVFSCLMRILKAMIIGAFVLSRIDQSTLPRKYEIFDPGFKSYIGFIQLENAHTHPILLTFCNVLLNSRQEKSIQHGEAYDNDIYVVTEGGRAQPKGARTEPRSPRSTQLRNRWLVALTLTHNPGLRLKRKRVMGRDRSGDVVTAVEDVIVSGFGSVMF